MQFKWMFPIWLSKPIQKPNHQTEDRNARTIISQATPYIDYVAKIFKLLKIKTVIIIKLVHDKANS